MSSFKQKVTNHSFKVSDMTPENTANAFNHINHEISKIRKLDRSIEKLEAKVDKIILFIVASVLVPILLLVMKNILK